MSVAVKLPVNLIDEAKRYASIYHRSVPKQIEFWSNIGKLMEENPDLTYNFIREILLARKEAENGEVEEYKFS